MKKNVFISYSRKDEILISKFRQEERGREFEILIDEQSILKKKINLGSCSKFTIDEAHSFLNLFIYFKKKF